MAESNATSAPVVAAGRLHRQRQRRIRNAARAVLALGIAILLFAALRPLPAPPDAQAPRLPDVATLPTGDDSVDDRERRLAELSRAGNVFAPDRLAWRDDEVQVATTDAEDEPPATETTTPVSPGAAKPGLGPIRLTERPTAFWHAADGAQAAACGHRVDLSHPAIQRGMLDLLNHRPSPR